MTTEDEKELLFAENKRLREALKKIGEKSAIYCKLIGMEAYGCNGKNIEVGFRNYIKCPQEDCAFNIAKQALGE